MSKLSLERLKHGYTQEYMAKKLDIAVSTYNQYENCNRNIPVEIVNKICFMLKIKVSDIFLPVKFTVSK